MNPIHPSKIHKGDLLWECSQYGSIQIEILTEPEHEVDKWTWKAKTPGSNLMDYLITDGLEHYGPKIYAGPVYLPVTFLDGSHKTNWRKS